MTIAGACALTAPWGTPPHVRRSLDAMRLDRTERSPTALRQQPGVVFGCCDDGQIAERDSALALFDGRLDNRSDLLRTFHQHRATTTDADLAILAHARWGESFADHLVGEFSCAVWDPAASRLLIARDALGARPLFFWHDDATLFFATEPRGLLAQPAVPKAVDERWIGRLLAAVSLSDASTLYRGIQRVLAGHVVRVDGEGVHQHRHWRPETLAPIRFARDDDYADAFRTVLDDAVRCRIGETAAIGSHLSSGFDSSTVTVTAARLLAARGDRLTAFTAVPAGGHDRPGMKRRFGDEGPLAALIAARHPNIDHVLIPNLSGSLFDAIDGSSAAAETPVLTPFNQIWFGAIGEAARARGLDVILTGLAGNASISYNGNGWLTQLAQQRRWLRLLHELRALHRRGTSWPSLINQHVVPQLPPALRRRLRAMAGHPERSVESISLIRPEFAARLGLADEAADTAGDLKLSRDGSSDIRLALLLQTIDAAMYLRSNRRMFGIEMTDPTADRRLVEFCLAIPPEQFLRHGEPRALLRRAMRGILPDEILDARARGLQAADWHVGLTAARLDITAEVERLGRNALTNHILDVPRMRRMVEDWPTGDWNSPSTYDRYFLALSRGISIGRYVRRIDEGES